MTNQYPPSLTESTPRYQRHNIIQPKEIFPGNKKKHFKCLSFFIAVFFKKYLLAASYVNTKALL